jgi:hypothetical protein
MVSMNNSISAEYEIPPLIAETLHLEEKEEAGRARTGLTDEDDALVGLGAALGAAEQLGHELHRRHVLEVRRHLLLLLLPPQQEQLNSRAATDGHSVKSGLTHSFSEFRVI